MAKMTKQSRPWHHIPTGLPDDAQFMDDEKPWPDDRPLNRDELERALERVSDRHPYDDDIANVILHLLKRGTGDRVFETWEKFLGWVRVSAKHRRRRRRSRRWRSDRVNPPTEDVALPEGHELPLVFVGATPDEMQTLDPRARKYVRLSDGEDENSEAGYLAPIVQAFSDRDADFMIRPERIEFLVEILGHLRAKHEALFDEMVAALKPLPAPVPRRLYGRDVVAKRKDEARDRAAVAAGLKPVERVFYPSQKDRQGAARFFEVVRQHQEVRLQIERTIELLAEEGISLNIPKASTAPLADDPLNWGGVTP